MKKKASLPGARLHAGNLKEYFISKLGMDIWVNPIEYQDKCLLTKIGTEDGLLQEDYGGSLDCTLTSLTKLYSHKAMLNEEIVYAEIEEIAKKKLYSPEKFGTNPVFINSIMKECNKRFNVLGMPVSKLNPKFDYICSQLAANRPMLLNMVADGRNYYKGHTVLVVGVQTFKIRGQEARMLVVFDNWTKERSYVDYDMLFPLFTVNYLK